MTSKHSALALALGFTASLLALVHAQAATVQFQEDASPTAAYQSGATFAREINPTTTFDGFNGLYIGTDGSGPTGRVRSFFSFDVSALPDGAAISSVTFSLRGGSADSSNVSAEVPIELRLLAGPFNEAALSWNNQPAYSTLLSTITANPRQTDAGFTFAWPSSDAFVAAAQAASDANGTLNFLARVDDGAEAQPGVRKAFFPRDDDTSPPMPAFHPLLRVTLVPEPASWSLLLGGAGLIRAVKRRRCGRPAVN